VREFVDEAAVLSRWLGRDIAAESAGVVPAWSVFRFRDAAVFVPDGSESAGRMYLVCGEAVQEFVLSQVTIDQAYVQLLGGGALPAVA
jgi:hypothetical protein